MITKKDSRLHTVLFWLGICANLVSAVLAFIVVVRQQMARGLGLGQFRYYTVLSNILALIGCIVMAVFLIREFCTGKQTPRAVRVFKLSGVIGVAVTFLVCLTILGPTNKDGVSAGYYFIFFSSMNMLCHHLICPWLCILTFLLTDRLGPAPAERLPKKIVWYALIPSFLYAVVTIALNFLKVMKGPYFFLHVYEQPWYMTLLYFILVPGLMVAVGFALWILGENKPASGEHTMKMIKTEEITSFEIVTLRLSGMRAPEEYEIVPRDGAAEMSHYTFRYKGGGEEERDLEVRVVLPMEMVLQLLNECRILSWDGFCGKHPHGVLDGTMFTLTAVVNDGKKIYASGSENFPPRFREFRDGIVVPLLTAQKEGE